MEDDNNSNSKHHDKNISVTPFSINDILSCNNNSKCNDNNILCIDDNRDSSNHSEVQEAALDMSKASSKNFTGRFQYIIISCRYLI